MKSLCNIEKAHGDITKVGDNIMVISFRRPRQYHGDIELACVMSRRSAVISRRSAVILRRAVGWRRSLCVVSYLGR